MFRYLEKTKFRIAAGFTIWISNGSQEVGSIMLRLLNSVQKLAEPFKRQKPGFRMPFEH